MSIELTVWAKPAGQTDALHEQIMSTQCKTLADVERIKKIAGKDGWHSFRVVKLDLNAKPDFARAVR